MAQPLEVKRGNRAPGSNVINMTDDHTAEDLGGKSTSTLDTPESRNLLRKLLQWYWWEKEQQATNRLEMALDADFYDGLQWSQEDAQTLRDRGQMPLVFNELAPMVDWLIGTERRTRVDWSVLPRAEDDVQAADAKSKVLKYVADMNRTAFNRSRAFSDAVKVGIGWLDDGVRNDPTQDALYSQWENWRFVLWDSRSQQLDLSDARYLFRWRWVDEDIAIAMFPDRAEQIRKACENSGRQAFGAYGDDEYQDGFLPGHVPSTSGLEERTGVIIAAGNGTMVDAKRRRVKLIEAQFRVPAKVQIVADGPFRGSFYSQADTVLADAVLKSNSSLVERVTMRVHMAVMTEGDLLAYGQSIYRHNRFSLTPVWAYRRSRDNMPYGPIRRLRDIQEDLNKRASKANHLLNTNQIVMDEGAVDDPEVARDEADRPDGMIVKKQGKAFDIRRDSEMSVGQVNLMTIDAQAIQRQGGVNDENMGRQTNAVSGEAIKARQIQGSVTTTELFDNLRLAIQIQGEKQLSLIEQFYTEEKVIRLTGAKNKIEWVKINQPEQQPDGSWRILNDIAASVADFVVSEQDYSGTMRQVMFDSLLALGQRLPPQLGVQMLITALEFSDLPNKDDVAQQLRKMTGQPDPSGDMTPEQQQQLMEAQQMQREQAMLAMEEQRGKVREINAKAAKIEAEAQAAGAAPEGSDQQAMQLQQQLLDVQRQASDQLDAMQQKLLDVQRNAQEQTAQIRRDADTSVEVARINGAYRLQVAEVQSAANDQLDTMSARIKELESLLGGASSQGKPGAEQTAAKPEPEGAKQTASAPSDEQKPTKKRISVERDAQGKIVGATVEHIKE